MAAESPRHDTSVDLIARAQRAPRLPLMAFGIATCLFFAISFVLCVGYDMVFPQYAMHQAWAPLMPGFTWLNWRGFLVGLADSFAYGLYVTLIFVPLFNFFAVKFEP